MVPDLVADNVKYRVARRGSEDTTDEYTGTESEAITCADVAIPDEQRERPRPADATGDPPA